MTEIIEKEMTEQEMLDREEWAATEYERAVANMEELRRSAYQTEADPLYFQWQAGEGTEEAWQAKRAEIRERYPYPEQPKK